MSTTIESPPAASRRPLWTGRALSALVTLFLLMDGVTKILKVEPVLKACAELDVPAWTIPILGVVLTAAAALQAFPPTAVLGAIVVTGYLGGAVWTHLRLGGPAFPVAFPVILGALMWLGLWLRDPRLRALLPIRRSSA